MSHGAGVGKGSVPPQKRYPELTKSLVGTAQERLPALRICPHHRIEQSPAQSNSRIAVGFEIRGTSGIADQRRPDRQNQSAAERGEADPREPRAHRHHQAPAIKTPPLRKTPSAHDGVRALKGARSSDPDQRVVFGSGAHRWCHSRPTRRASGVQRQCPVSMRRARRKSISAPHENASRALCGHQVIASCNG